MSDRPLALDRTRLAGVALVLAAVAPAFALADTPALRVEPPSISLRGAELRQQLAVSLENADGSALDVTVRARLVVDPPGVASVSPSGVVTAIGDGPAILRVEYDGRTVEASVDVRDSARLRPASYRHDVAALLSKSGCNSGPCHGNINGKGGFRLSLRGDDPDFDLASIDRDTFGRRVDQGDPPKSLVLLKPTGRVPHEGGQRFASHSPEASTLLRWIASGAGDDIATAPRLVKLDVFPKARISQAPSLSQQLVVTATFADGSTRDVTRQASYDLDDPTQVSRSRPRAGSRPGDRSRRPSPSATSAAGG